jgi:hypothetical protein
MTDMEVDAAVPASTEKTAPVLPGEAAAAASPAADEKPVKKTKEQVEVLEKLFEGDAHPSSAVHPHRNIRGTRLWEGRLSTTQEGERQRRNQIRRAHNVHRR